MENSTAIESTDMSKKESLLEKSDSDFRIAIANLLHAQSTLFIYLTQKGTSDVFEKFQEFQIKLKDIDHISHKIKEISYKSRILSINASIEAAHAGSRGKGFTVVAEEIGGLSSQTTKATDEVNNINKMMYENSEINQKSLDKLNGYVNEYTNINKFLIDDVFKLLIIQENGFILTELAKRIENHAVFMRSLLIDPSPAKKISDCHTCAFGVWYDQNREKYKSIPGYESMYETHKDFHEAAIAFNNTLNSDMLMKLLILSAEILKEFMRLIDSFKIEIQKDPTHYGI